MKVRKYIIVDFIESDIKDLKTQLLKFPLLELARVCTSLEEAVETITRESVDLVFLATRVGSDCGLNLLKIGLSLPPIIVMSTYQEDALVCYESGIPIDFLLKPFDFERLVKALNRALALQFASNSLSDMDSVFLKTGRKIQRFTYQSIDYIESYGIYAKVHTSEGPLVVNERVSTLAHLLPSRFFIQVHKSYLINIGKITSFDRANLYIGSAKIPIGISFRSKLGGLLNLLDAKGEVTAPVTA